MDFYLLGLTLPSENESIYRGSPACLACARVEAPAVVETHQSFGLKSAVEVRRDVIPFAAHQHDALSCQHYLCGDQPAKLLMLLDKVLV